MEDSCPRSLDDDEDDDDVPLMKHLTCEEVYARLDALRRPGYPPFDDEQRLQLLNLVAHQIEGRYAGLPERDVMWPIFCAVELGMFIR